MTAGAGTSPFAPISLEEPLEKKARHEEGDGGRGKENETILITEEEEERGGETGEGETNTEAGVRPRDVPWAPELCHYSGRLIHHADQPWYNIWSAPGLRSSKGC